MGMCRDLEKKIGLGGINLRVGDFRNRICKSHIVEFEEQIRDDSGTDRSWNIPFYSNEKLNNLPENKGKFSWVLRDELAQAMEELGIVSNNERVLFCNIAYMKHYDCLNYEEKPINGGQYIIDTGDAFEKYNFHRCEDGMVRGFVETKYVGGYKNGNRTPKQLHIENIDPSYKEQDEIDYVTVVFCAKNPDKNIDKTVIVGWYKNAKVYRNRKEYLERPFNLETKYEHAILLSEDERTFEIPRAKSNDDNIGFGQANIWYANKNEHKSFVDEVLKYIDAYTKEKYEKDVSKENLTQDDELNEEITNHRFNGDETFEYTKEVVKKQEPKISFHGVLIYKRERKRANNAIIHSKHQCEIDAKHISFKRKNDGFPYMEAHHLIPMSKQDLFEYSLDVEENIVSLCSQCHREIHHGENADALIKKLYNDRKKLLKNKKIGVSLDELLSYYGF